MSDGKTRPKAGGEAPGKTLLPELLPAPRASQGATPKERVTERARQLIQRFREVGVAGAAVVGMNCGQVGGGYEVVDPLPPPAYACAAVPDPFVSLRASAEYGAKPPNPPLIVLRLRSEATGILITAARVTGGTLVGTDNQYASSSSFPTVTLTAAPASDSSVLEIEVDLGCGNVRTTRRYRILYHPPRDNEVTLPVEELPPPA